MALLGAIGTLCSIAFGYVGYQQGIKNICKDEGKENGELKADIKYIKSGIDDIKLDLKVQVKRVNELAERVTRIEESARQAHKRIDEIKDS